MNYKRFAPYSKKAASDPVERFDFSPDSELGKIERAVDGAECRCGGTITMRNSVMLCSVCGYGASIGLDKVMNTRTHPDEATPLTHDLDDFTIHDPVDAVTLKRPSAEYIILLVVQDSGAPSDLVKEWLVNTNFKDAVTI